MKTLLFIALASLFLARPAAHAGLFPLGNPVEMGSTEATVVSPVGGCDSAQCINCCKASLQGTFAPPPAAETTSFKTIIDGTSPPPSPPPQPAETQIVPSEGKSN